MKTSAKEYSNNTNNSELKILTYDLQNYNYYKDIKIFTDNILEKSSEFVDYFFNDLFNYLKKNSKKYFINTYNNNNRNTNNNNIRDPEQLENELKFELIMVGVLWNTYSLKSHNIDLDNVNLLKELGNYRNNLNPEQSKLKEDIDEIRGHLNTIFFLDYSNAIKNYETNLDNFKKLIKYLEASSEFNYELKAINEIYKYLITKNTEEVEKILSSIIKYGKYFTKESEKHLGKYTYNVVNYINESFEAHINKEDIIFCNRKETEYHLNMFGAEIMNRLFRKEFKNRPRKAVLVPGCMKRNIKKCQAKEEKLGEVCKLCNNNCNVCKITKKGLNENFETYIISHESAAFKNATEEDKKELGIIGVACVLNLISGGWKAESLGIPPQCVIIDYVGCINHWDNIGFPTNINFNELDYLLK